MRNNDTAARTTPPAGLRRPMIARPDAMRLGADEYRRVAELLAEFGPDDWIQATDCPEWSVQQLVSHVVGMTAMAASVRESLRQNRIASKRPGGEAALVDALTALQVREFGRRTPEELVALFSDLGPRAARGRRRTPGFIRRRSMPETEVFNGVPERWSFGYLLDIILTRDPWMHRIDLCRATGHTLRLTAAHDGQIVDDVVREWAQRHGKPYRLTLTGTAGGSWSSADGDGEAFELDAIEFCRALSGRGPAEPPLGTEVPF